jgi:hypothetical protein
MDAEPKRASRRKHPAKIIAFCLGLAGVVVLGIIGDGLESNNDRCIVISKRARSSSYWTLLPEGDKILLQSAEGQFKGEFIDIAALDTPNRNPPGAKDGYVYARNLLIGRVRFEWKLVSTPKGHTLQASRMSYTDWYISVDDSVEPEQRVEVTADPSLEIERPIRSYRRTLFDKSTAATRY